MDVISHTMKQNKVLQDLLAKTTDAVLHFQQQRDRDMQQLMAKSSELSELKLAYQELKNEMKQLKEDQTNNNNQQQVYKSSTSRSQLLDDARSSDTNSKFMERLMNTPLLNPPGPLTHRHSLAASSPSHSPSSGNSSLESSPSPSHSPEITPPGLSEIVPPLDINGNSPPHQNSINNDVVSENLKKKLIALAKVI